MSAASRALPRPRALSRIALVGAGAAAGTALLAIPASAHVSFTPGSVQQGSAAVLTLHVPNEESNADVTQVDVRIPTDHPIAQLLVQPVPGWTISVRTTTLAKPLVTDDGSFSQAVSEVIWSGGKVAPDQFQDFTVSADPLPKGISQLAFKAIQTYSNGDVVRWIDLPQPGQPVPDHPAAVLNLTSGAAISAAQPAAAPPLSGSDTASSGARTAAPGPDALTRGIAFGALGCGLGALALGWLNRRHATPAPAGTTSAAEDEPEPPLPTWAAQVTGKSGQPKPSPAPAVKRSAGREQSKQRAAGSGRDTARR